MYKQVRFDKPTSHHVDAYQWQIELLFKFLKRTLNGIHLFNPYYWTWQKIEPKTCQV